MMIQTLDKNYEVLQYEYSDSNMERYICQEEKSGIRCTIIRLKNKLWIVKVMEFLMLQLENHHFTDFISCFAGEEYLHIAMAYAEGISLMDKLQNEECPLEERLITGKNILQKIMLQDMPDYFLKECLAEENVILTPDLEVGFRYSLSGITGYDKVQYVHVLKKLRRLFEILFSRELKQKMIPPLNQFYHSLGAGKYKDILEIYKAYIDMQKAVQGMPAEDIVMPKTWGFSLWDKIKKVFAPLKKILAVLLMLCAILFLINTVRRQMQEDGEKRIFEYIGTLEIQEE